MENLTVAIQPNPIFSAGRTVSWPALRGEKTPGSWGFQAAEIRATCPNSVGPPNPSHSYSSFTCFLNVFTRLMSYIIAVVGSRVSCSTFCFFLLLDLLAPCSAHTNLQIVQMKNTRSSDLGVLALKQLSFSKPEEKKKKKTDNRSENSLWNFSAGQDM